MDREEKSASTEKEVAGLYQDSQVADSYIAQRFSFSWSRLLHEVQVKTVNRAIATCRPQKILEIAPGPARIAPYLKGISKGIMLDYSEEMLQLAGQKLKQLGLDEVWQLRHANAFDLEKSEEKFDFIYTFRFIRHFNEEERFRLYRAIQNCLESGGWLIFDAVNRTTREKIEARRPDKSSASLDVYDVTYDSSDFIKEMEQHGFSLESLVPVVRHFGLQSWISYKFDHRIKFLSRFTVQLLEKLPSWNPLEWVAVCRKR